MPSSDDVTVPEIDLSCAMPGDALKIAIPMIAVRIHEGMLPTLYRQKPVKFFVIMNGFDLKKVVTRKRGGSTSSFDLNKDNRKYL
jgi:hypothetical protein